MLVAETASGFLVVLASPAHFAFYLRCNFVVDFGYFLFKRGRVVCDFTVLRTPAHFEKAVYGSDVLCGHLNVVGFVLHE